MSIENLDNNDFIDVKELEKLANEFFTALPGKSYNTYTSPLQTDQLKGAQNITEQKELFDQRSVPSSVAGSGISPSAIQQGNSFNISDPQTSLPDPHFAGAGNVPGSEAGSGISPSAVHPKTSFNLSEPPTSLPDPHFAGTGHVPKSLAGSGISPHGLQRGALGQAYNGYLEKPDQVQEISSSSSPVRGDIFGLPGLVGHFPFVAELPFESELRSLLNATKFSSPGSSLPFEKNPSASDVQFYFLSGKEYSPFGKRVPASVLNNKPATKEGSGLMSQPFDVNLVRKDFPILQERVNGHPLIWLDNAATTQKPKQVIDRLSYFYEHENSNIHRAAHQLAARATDAYEAARKKVQTFLNAASVNEIVFVRGSTEAINLVAQSWGDQYLNKGDEIVISHLEHHANIVPWQQLATKKGLRLRVIPVDNDGQILIDEYAKLLGPKTKLVSLTQVSNALGTVTPAKQMVEMAHLAGAKVLVDGAQAVSHMRADVTALNCDWYVFSGHKVFGPTGIGILYGKETILNEMQPWQGGGNMIKDVTFEHTEYHDAPGRFEAGTGNIADAVGLGAAIDYVSRIGIDFISQYEHYLLLYATQLLKEIPGLRLIGTAPEKAGVLSFVLEGFKTEEVGTALNQYGIAVRSGHHCAQPILRRFGVEATVRPSLALYNTCADIDAMIDVLRGLRQKKKL